jgi:hypothetical protein
MRAGLALAGVVLFGACGGSPPPRDVHIEAPLPSAAPVAAKPPVHPLSVPRDAALVASVDLGGLLKNAALRGQLETALGLPSGALEPSALGLDPGRPLVVAIAGSDAAQRALIDDLRPLARSKQPTPATSRAIRRVLAVPSWGTMRVLVPASDPRKLEQTAGALLEKDGWHKRRDGWAKHDATIEVSDDDKSVAFDFGGGRRGASLRNDGAAPALEGHALRATFSPRALADYGFLQGVTTSCEVASGDSIDASQRDRIAAQGFWESGRIYPLATFDAVDVELDLLPLEITVRAKPGRAFTMPTPNAFAPSMSIAVDGAVSDFEESRTFALAWTFPGGDAEKMLEMMRDSGWVGLVVALPHVIAAGPSIERDFGGIDMSRFDRSEVVHTAARDAIYVGVLPVGSKRAAAECALAPSTPCKKMRLKLGAIVAVGDRFGRLVRIQNRFVVVASRDRDALKAKLAARTASGLHVEAAPNALAKGLVAPSLLPARVTGDATSENGAVVFRLVTVH